MGTSDAYVIIGNSALLKCEVPSFVGDFVSVVNWIDSKGNEHFPTENHSKITTKTISQVGYTQGILICQ